MKELQFAVIGLGIFGSSVALRLSEFGYEVLAIDKSIENVERIADRVTKAVSADSTKKENLEELGINEFDTVVVAIGSDLEAEILTVLNLQELGVKNIVAKAKNHQAKSVLTKLGVEKVVRPEKEMGEKLADSFVPKAIINATILNDEYSIIEIQTPPAWIGHNLIQLNVRKTYHMNVVGLKKADEKSLSMDVDPNYILTAKDELLVIGKNETISRYGFLAK